MKYFKAAFHSVGEFQSRLLLTIMYFAVLPWFSLIAAISGDPLSLKDKPQWLKRPQAPIDLENARRQF